MPQVRIKNISKLDYEGTLEGLGYAYFPSEGGYVSKDRATIIGVMRQPYIGTVTQFGPDLEVEHAQNVEELENLNLLVETGEGAAIMKGKTCKITNGQFSWVLEVDGNSIPFQGHYSAVYFLNLYKSLGYRIEIIDPTGFLQEEME